MTKPADYPNYTTWVIEQADLRNSVWDILQAIDPEATPHGEKGKHYQELWSKVNRVLNGLPTHKVDTGNYEDGSKE